MTRPLTSEVFAARHDDLPAPCARRPRCLANTTHGAAAWVLAMSCNHGAAADDITIQQSIRFHCRLATKVFGANLGPQIVTLAFIGVWCVISRQCSLR